jgi:S-adenosylmethionine synthetase
MRPRAIIEQLDLLRPIYRETAAYGHFGRKGFPWEKTNRAKQIAKDLKGGKWTSKAKVEVAAPAKGRGKKQAEEAAPPAPVAQAKRGAKPAAAAAAPARGRKAREASDEAPKSTRRVRAATASAPVAARVARRPARRKRAGRR